MSEELRKAKRAAQDAAAHLAIKRDYANRLIQDLEKAFAALRDAEDEWKRALDDVKYIEDGNTHDE